MADKNETPASSDPVEQQPVAQPAVPAASAPGAPTPRAPKASWTKYLTPALALVAALIVGGVAGVLIGQSTANASSASSVRGGFGNGAGGVGGYGGFGNRAGGAGSIGGGFTAGTITAIDGGTLTVKLADGSTVKVDTSSSTTVTQTSTTSVDKLAAGETITVVGQKDASGNITATRIAQGQAGLGGFGGRPGSSATVAPSN